MLDKISKKMMELGFTKYEAKAYVALLQNYPVTRYQISKKSGVPRSAIYDVIQKLENLGVVNVLSTKPEKYVPLPPEEFLRMLERQYHQKLGDLRENLAKMNTDIEPEQLWNITGYRNLIEKATEMIQITKKEIYLSAWNSEILQLERILREAQERGVKIVIFSFTEVPKVGRVYSYCLQEKELEKVWDHKLILVCDRGELLMGEANLQVQRKAAWTKNKAIIGIAANHIVLDITLFGIRAGVDVSDAVIEMHPGELDLLGRLLREKYPENPLINLDFSRNSLKEFLKFSKVVEDHR
jgi:sugar-specific transcriptional regulator TrmB